ncbi:MAG TPA: hypothetical protein VFG81_18790 [Anaerolineales bacterium]|nr:hypothetical protein [Anaerolineales bacterium]
MQKVSRVANPTYGRSDGQSDLLFFPAPMTVTGREKGCLSSRGETAR